jgi:hypothetical protein
MEGHADDQEILGSHDSALVAAVFAGIKRLERQNEVPTRKHG